MNGLGHSETVYGYLICELPASFGEDEVVNIVFPQKGKMISGFQSTQREYIKS